MPTGLPWDDPAADPMGDYRALMTYWSSDRYRKAVYEERRRWAKQRWVLFHLAYCFGEITERTTDAGDLETRCTGCHESMLEVAAKATIQGARPQLIEIDEATFRRERYGEWTPHPEPRILDPRPQAPDPGLLDLCLEHRWLQARPISNPTPASTPLTSPPSRSSS